MYVYQEEKFADIVEEVKPLLYEHWKELANHQDIRPLDPNYELYTLLSNNDILRIYTVRTEGKLIGYSCFYVSPNLHYRTWLYASCDVYYIDPAYRTSGVGKDMIGHIERQLKALGVKAVMIQDKVNHSHEKFFKFLGYTPVEQHYEKVLD